jgi:DNA invertase Pin-like site-specific DNA recombinase
LIGNGAISPGSIIPSGVEFVRVDMSAANRLTLHVLAAVPEHERQMISERTVATLATARARGVRLC